MPQMILTTVNALGLLVPVQESLHQFRGRARRDNDRAMAHAVGQQAAARRKAKLVAASLNVTPSIGAM